MPSVKVQIEWRDGKKISFWIAIGVWKLFRLAKFEFQVWRILFYYEKKIITAVSRSHFNLFTTMNVCPNQNQPRSWWFTLKVVPLQIINLNSKQLASRAINGSQPFLAICHSVWVKFCEKKEAIKCCLPNNGTLLHFASFLRG